MFSKPTILNLLPLTLVISLITGCIEVDLSVPSLPDIADYFAVSSGTTQMTIAINFLGFCLSSALHGPLSDAFGRRIVMLVGNGVMALGAIGCTLANNIEMLLLARFIQGLGASTSAVVAFAITSEVYDNHRATKIIGFMNFLISMAMAIAPVCGSYINKLIGWHGSYQVIAIISVISWFILYFLLPETIKDRQNLVLAKVQHNYKILLTNRDFLFTSAIPTLLFAAWMSFVACGAFLYMETYQVSIEAYGLHQGVIIFVFSAVSFRAGQIIEFFGELKCLKYGLGFSVVGAISLQILALASNNSPYLTTILMSLDSVGVALLYPIVFSKSLEIFPEIKGTASSAIMTMRALICALFIFLASLSYNGQLYSVTIIILIATMLAAVLTLQLLKNPTNSIKFT